MKQLTCEMCGSTDLMKRDGVFVCQSCGMKYSVEDAKKMMIEGTVEVQGTVQIKNTAQLENLWRLAQSSYDSKNYTQAEEFCNQIIAMDADNYEAWKLKGEAINYQITGTNDRIAEVFNCILTSYRVLDADGKEEHREEILASIRECLEGEIDFALSLLKSNRPTDEMLKKVTSTFPKCASNVLTAYTELGYSKEEAEDYKTYIKNYYIKKVNKLCADSWDNQVWHNYYRGGFNKGYHPTREIMTTFIHEGKNLVALLENAEEYFDNKISATEKRENYRLRNLFARKIQNVCCFKLMEHTTTNGYGAVVSRYTQWEVDTELSAEAKAYWGKVIDKTCALFDQQEVSMAKEDPATRAKMLQKWKAERDAIDTGFKITGGWIFAILLWVGLAIASFTVVVEWCEGFEWFATVVGVFFSIGAIICAVSAISKAKATQESNISAYNRITNKIKELN